MDSDIRPRGPAEVIASYATYPEAQQAIDALADHGFPVERLTIVAGDLRFVEQITGRVGYVEAAGQGATVGALSGAFLGFIFGIFAIVNPVTSGLLLAFWGLIIGGLVGTIIGLLAHWLTGGRRDFASVSSLQAGRYDVLADIGVAEEARRRLSGLPRAA